MSRPVLDATVTYRAHATGDYSVEVDCPSVVGEPRATVPAVAVTRGVEIGAALTNVCLAPGASPWSESQVQQAGQELFNLMLPGATADAVRNVVHAAHARGALARIRFRLDADEKYLHEVPWELLYDARIDGFLALHPSALLSRYVLQATAVSTAPVAGSLGVAALAASPAGLPALGVEKDLDEVKYALGSAARVDVFPRCQWSAATALRDRAGLHVLHLAMHGGVRDNSYNLAFEDAHGNARWVPRSELVNLITDLPDLRMIVLSACQSAEKYGLAKALAGLNVPAVVGYRTNVRDATANQFASAFYDALRTHPIDQAVRNARARLRGTDPARLGWLLPVLYLRTANPVLVPTGETYRELTAFGEPQFPPANPLPPPPAPVAASPPPTPVRTGGISLNLGGAEVGNLRVVGVLQGAGATPPAVVPTDIDIRIDAVNARIRNASAVQYAFLSQAEIAAFFAGLDNLN